MAPRGYHNFEIMFITTFILIDDKI